MTIPRDVIIGVYGKLPVWMLEQGADLILESLRAAGYAVVPVEPTDKMVHAGYAAWQEVGVGEENVYRAMIAAAQEQTDARNSET